jgi:glycosyltransferase involved in cell wall biosynthesis
VQVKILVVELEPTHYKTDLWNAFVDSGRAALSVVYTERRNWSPDAGHDYQRFPVERHESMVLDGKGLAGALRSTLKVLAMFRKVRPDLTYIAGYVHPQTVLAILYASLFGRPFVVHADVFNNGMPSGRWRRLKWLVRQALRRLVFARAEAVLVCGRMGIETARAAGCPERKILDFPYSVSLARILADQPATAPSSCLDDLRAAKPVVFFSGRMIPRKGLPTLLEAMAVVSAKADWVLWIEGAGPELQAYAALADALGLGGRCRFLGFCQYDLHSWLMRSAGIVVVPSFEDSWGIVVDEGLQLGKAVISSDATGSGYDRIEPGVNGFVFPAGDVRALAGIITELLDAPDLMARVGRAAQAGPRNVRPEDNVATLMKVADGIR